MATTTKTLTKQAETFLTVSGGDGKPSDDSFILNSTDFIKLQLYLKCGIAVPATKELFASRYPWDDFKTFTKVDQHLYNAQLVDTHERCASFEKQVAVVVIDQGGQVAKFADECDEYYAAIEENLSTVGAKNSKANDSTFEEAKKNIKRDCRRIASRADTLNGQCDGLHKMFQDFQTTTSSDQKQLKSLSADLKRVWPSKDEQDALVVSLTKEAKDLVDKAKAEADENRKKVGDSLHPHWYEWIEMAMDPAVMGYWMYNLKQYADEVKICNKRYEEALASEKQRGVRLATAFNHVNALSDQMDEILAHIGGAIEAVGKMGVTLSDIKTFFINLSEVMGQDAIGDVDEPSYKDRDDLLHQDLKAAQKTWKQVSKLGTAFKQNGGLLKFDQTKA